MDEHEENAAAHLRVVYDAASEPAHAPEREVSATARRPVLPDEDSLIVNVDGFEGPLDLLLVLARAQKVDLKRISILALVEQYLAFVTEARKRRLELAADYLVMAAWLAYLKSRLLLPEAEATDEEPTGEELAARLQFQLMRLEAMRKAARRIMERDRLGRDVFARGMPESIRLIRRPLYTDGLFDLLTAYARQRTRGPGAAYEVRRPAFMAIEDARHRLEGLLGPIRDWHALDRFLPEFSRTDDGAAARRRTALASTFTAGLELVRDGFLDIRQLRHFGPIYVRRRVDSTATALGPVEIPMEQS